MAKRRNSPVRQLKDDKSNAVPITSRKKRRTPTQMAAYKANEAREKAAVKAAKAAKKTTPKTKKAVKAKPASPFIAKANDNVNIDALVNKELVPIRVNKAAINTNKAATTTNKAVTKKTKTKKKSQPITPVANNALSVAYEKLKAAHRKLAKAYEDSKEQHAKEVEKFTNTIAKATNSAKISYKTFTKEILQLREEMTVFYFNGFMDEYRVEKDKTVARNDTSSVTPRKSAKSTPRKPDPSDSLSEFEDTNDEDSATVNPAVKVNSLAAVTGNGPLNGEDLYAEFEDLIDEVNKDTTSKVIDVASSEEDEE
ncbi:hypothetical protein TruAng_007362 [Truncatella angustata]|nr:hypothetical protein TruAng_007362 [Truncatella angustata]